MYGNALKEHDGHVRQLLDKLASTGLDKNTIVIYTSDNGAYQYMWPMGGTSPFRGDRGTTWEGAVRVSFVVRWPGAPAGRMSSEIVDMTDLLPTLAAAAGAGDVVSKLKAGGAFGSRSYKVHLDGYDQTALFTGKSDQSARNAIFYYDETVPTAIRHKQFKITFSAKMNGKWDRWFWAADEFANFENADSLGDYSGRDLKKFGKQNWVRWGVTKGLAYEQSLGSIPTTTGSSAARTTTMA